MNQDWRSSNASWAVPSAENRDDRITGATYVEPVKLTSLLVWTQTKLREVAESGSNVGQLVKISKQTGPERALICGSRSESSFVRKDGVRCNFQIVVREIDGNLELISYALHLDAPDHHEVAPQFLRWEYSAKRKGNVDAVKEPLAHLHPGHDKIRLPSPVLGPKELIAMFLSLELWN